MTPTSRYTPTRPEGDEVRPTLELVTNVELPRPANFLRSPPGPSDLIQQVLTIDVADLSDMALEVLAEAIKQDFIRNANQRRQARAV